MVRFNRIGFGDVWNSFYHAIEPGGALDSFAAAHPPDPAVERLLNATLPAAWHAVPRVGARAPNRLSFASRVAPFSSRTSRYLKDLGWKYRRSRYDYLFSRPRWPTGRRRSRMFLRKRRFRRRYSRK